MDDTFYASVTRLQPFALAFGGIADHFADAGVSGVGGGAVLSSAQSKYYGSSLYLDGVNSFLAMFSTPLAAQAFTIEAWVYPTDQSGLRTIYSLFRNQPGGFGYRLYCAGANVMFEASLNGTSWGISLGGTPTAIPVNTWTHVAACREASGAVRLYINGIQIYSATPGTGAISAATSASTLIGGSTTSAGVLENFWKGYLQDFRVTLGANRYPAGTSFTPPDRLVGTVSGTIKDDSGSAAIRSVMAVARRKARGWSGASDASGAFSIAVPRTQLAVLALDDDAGVQHNDLVLGRVVPV